MTKTWLTMRRNMLADIQNSSFIIISKQKMELYQYDYEGKLLQKCPIAIGKNPGDKVKCGDLKTPEGIFKIGQIEKSSTWTHDFKDDTLGPIKGAYGPYFINLEVPGQKGIGIHGTHDYSSIGKRISEGCIRMNNDQLIQLVGHIKSSTIVIITPGAEDISADMESH